MDFHDARRRIADSLAALDTNTIPDVYPDDEAETISFLFGLDRQRYGRWIRDIENGMATMPTTVEHVRRYLDRIFLIFEIHNTPHANQILCR